ncbi:MAG: gfo/Idh/MocA family oxidoreductase [Acidobacteria bacterium]|nr:MAG: gfo/Idh/MocA family oxidoreductase [Acidobacteriota bacterium]
MQRVELEFRLTHWRMEPMSTAKNISNNPSAGGMDRREFVKSATAATAGLLLVSPEIAFGSRANSTPQLGMIGCGGRGTSVSEAFVTRAGVRLHALGDLFQDQLDKAKAKLDELNQSQGHATIDASKMFKGPRSCNEVVSSDVDIVLISTPPYFHPEHLELAVAAKKHIYLEKPVATDVQGCKKIQELGKKVEGKQSVHVGFQIRFSPEYRELTRRIQEGAIGDIACAQGYYLAGDLPRKAKPGMSPLEAKIRDWAFDRVLSGDVLVEQNIHIIDWINWVLKARPERVMATAGRKVRTDIGDVQDHFLTIYRYPGDVRVGFQSTQFLTKWADVCLRFFGSKGYAEAHYNGNVFIRGTNEWQAEPPPPTAEKQKPEVDPLSEATPEKVKAFVESIQSGQFHNQLDQGAESTLSAILGRQASYEGKEMTWDHLVKSNQHWKTDVELEKLT